MTAVAVVILNYNGEKLLPVFLPSVLSYSGAARIYVADNASTDGSVELLRQQFPHVKLIILEKNYGFCGGYNRAIDQINEEIIVLLNSDVEVTPGWLDPMLSMMETHAEVAAIQPKILAHRNREYFEYAGAAGGMIDSLGYPFCRGRVFDQAEKDNGQYDQELDIFWSTGACMMIRRSIYKELGGLDEYFFAHMEEIDLCWKIHRSGRRVMFTHRSVVYHLGAGTLAHSSPFKTFLNFRNGLILIYKHLGTKELLPKLLIRILLDWVAALRFLVKREAASAGSVIRAHYHFVKDLSRHQKKRKEIHRLFPDYPQTGIYSGSIVIDFYLRGKRFIGHQ